MASGARLKKCRTSHLPPAGSASLAVLSPLSRRPAISPERARLGRALQAGSPSGDELALTPLRRRPLGAAGTLTPAEGAVQRGLERPPDVKAPPPEGPSTGTTPSSSPSMLGWRPLRAGADEAPRSVIGA